MVRSPSVWTDGVPFDGTPVAGDPPRGLRATRRASRVVAVAALPGLSRRGAGGLADRDDLSARRAGSQIRPVLRLDPGVDAGVDDRGGVHRDPDLGDPPGDRLGIPRAAPEPGISDGPGVRERD